MTEAIALIWFFVTIIPVLLVGFLVAPFGLADDVSEGHGMWICGMHETQQRCEELQKNGWQDE